MFEFFWQILTYIGLVVVGFFLWATLTPFEVMGWWAGWFGDRIYSDDFPPDGLVRTVRPETDSYLIFLSGIGRVSGETFSIYEREFLQRLAAALPHTVIIDDIFPYSINNLALTGQRFFARLWRLALWSKMHGSKLIGYLINVRNLWQIMLSADKRYGPMYNQASAEVLMDGLLRYNYDLSRPVPVYLLAYSGAGQIAVGAAGYLAEMIDAPIRVISMSGIFSSDPSLLKIDHLYHIVGSKDRSQTLNLLAPGRWSLLPASAWNRVRRQGKVTTINVGPIGHTGRGGYLDATSELPDGVSYLDKTVSVIADIMRREVVLTE